MTTAIERIHRNLVVFPVRPTPSLLILSNHRSIPQEEGRV